MLIFGNKNIDVLFLTDKEGFRYAVSLLSYYFSNDTKDYFPEYINLYESFSIENILYKNLSIEALEHFQKVGKLHLNKDTFTKQDTSKTFIGFDLERILDHMLECQKPLYLDKNLF